jgi:hypothetical protein
MRLLRPALTLASLILLTVACSNSTTPVNNTPAAGDDDDDDTNPTPDASTSDSSTAGDDAASSGDGSSSADSGPVADGGEEVTCTGTASCTAGDACIADYATASVATSWCAYQQSAKRITEFTQACSGYHVVEISTGVVGALTIDYYDLTTGALVAVLEQSLNVQKSCSGTPAEVSSSPCGDAEGVTTELATACTD